MTHLFTRAGLGALAAGLLVTLSPKASRAEQFVLFDVTFTFTWEDAINAKPSQSHYYVKENNGLSLMRPDNWVTPVDYRNGKVHIHYEVLERPAGGQKTGWALCYVGNAGSYGCPYTDYYTEVGVYDKEVDMTNFYNDDTIDWSQGISEVDLVYTIDGSGHGHVHFYPELKDLTTPIKVRMAMVQVAKGDTYDPAGLPGGAAGGGGGMGGAGGASNGGGGMGGSPSAGAGSAGEPGMGGQPSLGGGGSGGAPASMPSAGTAPIASGGTGVTSAGTGSVTPTGLAPSGEDASCAFTAAAPSGRGAWLAALALGLWRRRRRSR